MRRKSILKEHCRRYRQTASLISSRARRSAEPDRWHCFLPRIATLNASHATLSDIQLVTILHLNHGTLWLHLSCIFFAFPVYMDQRQSVTWGPEITFGREFLHAAWPSLHHLSSPTPPKPWPFLQDHSQYLGRTSWLSRAKNPL